jgi:hypothetical protein
MLGLKYFCREAVGAGSIRRLAWLCPIVTLPSPRLRILKMPRRSQVRLLASV